MPRTAHASRYPQAAALALFVIAPIGCGSDASGPHSGLKKTATAGSSGAGKTAGSGGRGGTESVGTGGVRPSAGSSGVETGSGGLSSDSGGAGASGETSDGGTTSTGGTTNAGGTTSRGGSSGTGMGGGAAVGSQPLGAICANDANCSNADGAAVCCNSTCTLADQCPGPTGYLPCNSTADCSQYGGGKICCELDTAGQTMRYCTKQSGCSGKKLP